MTRALVPDRRFDEFEVGDLASFARRFAESDLEAFSRLSGDRNPLHTEEEYAKAAGYDGRVLPLHLTMSPLSAIAGMMLPGRRALYLSSDVRALKPVYFGDELVYSTRVIAKSAGSQVLTLRVIAIRTLDVVLEGTMHVKVRADVDAVSARDGVPALEHRFEHGKDARTVLVTGASGTIGRAIAMALLRRGWDLLLHHRRPDPDRTRLATEARATGRNLTFVKADLTQAAERTALCDLVAAEPTLAGIVHTASPPIDAPGAALMEVNVTALHELAEAVLPSMLRRQQGCILQIGSSATRLEPTGWADYVAAKAAAGKYLEELGRQYAAYGVGGKVVAPGYVRTRFSESLRPDGAPVLLPEEVADAAVRAFESGPAENESVWIEPGVRQPAHEKGRGLEQSDASPVAANQVRDEVTAFANLVRGFFDLGAGADLSEAEIDVTPGWDSLRHIELLLTIEDRLSLSFSSAEMDRTRRYADLAGLVSVKLRDKSLDEYLPAD